MNLPPIRPVLASRLPLEKQPPLAGALDAVGDHVYLAVDLRGARPLWALGRGTSLCGYGRTVASAWSKAFAAWDVLKARRT